MSTLTQHNGKSGASGEPDAITQRTKATWMAGDFGVIARSYESGAAQFVDGLDIQPQTRVLDVACGTGNITIPMARARAQVTGFDIAPNWLEQAQSWARSEGLTVTLDEGNAEQMPYADASFDMVVSMFGAMFAPRADVTAAELLRVCRPGGRIVMANWTPDGFIGQMFKTFGKHVPPVPGLPSPLLWGDEATVTDRLGGATAAVQCTQRTITLNFPVDPAGTVDCFRTYYGPIVRGFAALSPEDQQALQRDLEALWTEHNRAQDGTTTVDSTYLEVVAVLQ